MKNKTLFRFTIRFSKTHFSNISINKHMRMNFSVSKKFIVNKSFSSNKGIGIIKEQKKKEIESKKSEEIKNNINENVSNNNKNLIYENNIVKYKLLSTICFCGFYSLLNILYSQYMCDYGSFLRKEYFNLSLMSFVPILSVQIGFLIGNIVGSNKKINNKKTTDNNEIDKTRLSSFNVEMVLIYGGLTICGITILPLLKPIFGAFILCKGIM